MAFGTRGFENRRLKNQPRNGAKPTLTKDNSFLVFPFDLTMGYITSTENGIRSNDNARVFDYSTFQRVFTGLENVLAQWNGAYNISIANPGDTFITKEYVVGTNFRAFIPEESMGATFEPTAISGDFLAEFTQETFNLHTYEDIQEADLFKLFIIPGLKENKWLYITNATKYYNKDKTLDHVEITLSTLNNKIAKSGRAVEEYIQRSAPGEGYAWPKLLGDDVVLDDIKNRDIPITSFQLEGAGAWAIGTMYAYGRPTIQEASNGSTQSTFNPKIEAPRLLLPLRMETAIPSPVNTRPSAETDWLVGKFKPTLEEDFTDWKDQIQANYDLTQRAKYEGMLQSTEDAKIVDDTNPVSAGGSRDKLLWDPNFSFQVDKIYNTATDAFTGQELTLKKSITMPEMLAHNIFGLSAISTLPLSVQQNIAWSLKDIPIIGGYLSKLSFGIPLGWTNTSVKVSIQDIILAIPASLKDYANVLIKDSGKLRIDLNTFTDETATEDAISFSGIKATGSIWKTQLTDRFEKTINNNKYIFNTVDLGQVHPIKDNDGKDVVVADRSEKLLWDESCKPTTRNANTPGYIIDTSTFKAIAKMDYRTTFFNNETEVWTGTYQTNAKFTTSIRDWTNAIKYSNWKIESTDNIAYPDNIVAPNPPNVKAPTIKLNEIIGSKLINTLLYNPKKLSPNTLSKDPYEAQFENILKIDTSKYGGIQSFLSTYKELRLTIVENIGTFIPNNNKFGTYTGDEKTKVTNIVNNDKQFIINIDTSKLLNTTQVEAGITNYQATLFWNGTNPLGSIFAEFKYKTKIFIQINGDQIELSIKADISYGEYNQQSDVGGIVNQWLTINNATSAIKANATTLESYVISNAIMSAQ